MLHLFLAVLILVALAFLGLGINIIFFKKPFPETEISRNKEMYKRGIKCAKCDEMQKFRAAQKTRENLQHLTLDIEKINSNK